MMTKLCSRIMFEDTCLFRKALIVSLLKQMLKRVSSSLRGSSGLMLNEIQGARGIIVLLRGTEIGNLSRGI